MKLDKFYNFKFTAVSIFLNSANHHKAMASSQNQNVMAAAFSAKYNSKKEAFNFLTVEYGAYLPDCDTLTI